MKVIPRPGIWPAKTKHQLKNKKKCQMPTQTQKNLMPDIVDQILD